MSQCHYCASQDGVIGIQDHGICFECSFATCAHPSGRVDGYFHGEPCSCECRCFVCEYDIQDHARLRHGRDEPDPCFPALTSHGNLATFGGASSALVSDTTGDLIRPEWLVAFNRSLNLFNPGRKALLSILGHDWEQAEGRVVELASRPGDQFVEFAPAFFNAGTLERIMVLSVRSLATLGAVPEPPSLLKDIPTRVHGELLSWTQTNEPPSITSLEWLLPPVTRSERVRAIRSVFATTWVPHGAEQVARWVLETVVKEVEYA